jgi:release factor glutamine methyltransferase
VSDAPPDVIRTLRAAGCVFAEEEADLLTEAAADRDALDALVARRVAGMPLEHLLGRVEFGGLRLAVAPGVFVPRRRTEAVVHEAAALVRARAVAPVVVDLCCGAGAIAAALAEDLRRGGGPSPAELHATEIDPVAVGCARRNLEPYGGVVHLGDLDAPLPLALRGRVDVLVANVPYVPTGAITTMPPEARDHEPRRALDGGPDGLDVARRFVAAAPLWLAPGGAMLVETGERQAPVLAGAVAAQGLQPRIVVDDDLEATVVIGTAPPAP